MQPAMPGESIARRFGAETADMAALNSTGNFVCRIVEILKTNYYFCDKPN